MWNLELKLFLASYIGTLLPESYSLHRNKGLQPHSNEIQGQQHEEEVLIGNPVGESDRSGC